MNAFAENRKAHFDYELEETLEAGLVLTGYEAKAIRSGKVRLDGLTQSLISLQRQRSILGECDDPSVPSREYAQIIRSGTAAKAAFKQERASYD